MIILTVMRPVAGFLPAHMNRIPEDVCLVVGSGVQRHIFHYRPKRDLCANSFF